MERFDNDPLEISLEQLMQDECLLPEDLLSYQSKEHNNNNLKNTQQGVLKDTSSLVLYRDDLVSQAPLQSANSASHLAAALQTNEVLSSNISPQHSSSKSLKLEHDADLKPSTMLQNFSSQSSYWDQTICCPHTSVTSRSESLLCSTSGSEAPQTILKENICESSLNHSYHCSLQPNRDLKPLEVKIEPEDTSSQTAPSSYSWTDVEKSQRTVSSTSSIPCTSSFAVMIKQEAPLQNVNLKGSRPRLKKVQIKKVPGRCSNVSTGLFKGRNLQTNVPHFPTSVRSCYPQRPPSSYSIHQGANQRVLAGKPNPGGIFFEGKPYVPTLLPTTSLGRVFHPLPPRQLSIPFHWARHANYPLYHCEYQKYSVLPPAYPIQGYLPRPVFHSGSGSLQVASPYNISNQAHNVLDAAVLKRKTPQQCSSSQIKPQYSVPPPNIIGHGGHVNVPSRQDAIQHSLDKQPSSQVIFHRDHFNPRSFHQSSSRQSFSSKNVHHRGTSEQKTTEQNVAQSDSFPSTSNQKLSRKDIRTKTSHATDIPSASFVSSTLNEDALSHPSRGDFSQQYVRGSSLHQPYLQSTSYQNASLQGPSLQDTLPQDDDIEGEPLKPTTSQSTSYSTYNSFCQDATSQCNVIPSRANTLQVATIKTFNLVHDIPPSVHGQPGNFREVSSGESSSPESPERYSPTVSLGDVDFTILAMKHHQNRRPSTVVQIFPITKKKYESQPMPCSRFNTKSVILEEHVYVTGGEIHSTTPQTETILTNLVNRINISKPDSQWEIVAPMTWPRKYHGICGSPGCIVVAGGFHGISVLQSVESYSLVYDKWTEIAPLNKPRFFCELIFLEGYLYCIGGSDPVGVSLSDVDRFVTDTKGFGSWLPEAPMREQRSRFAVVQYQQSIFAMGGQNYMGVLYTAEQYTSTTKQWTYIANMSTERTQFSACAHDQRVFIAGGHHSTFAQTRSPKFIQYYSMRKNAWRSAIGNLPPNMLINDSGDIFVFVSK